MSLTSYRAAPPRGRSGAQVRECGRGCKIHFQKCVPAVTDNDFGASNLHGPHVPRMQFIRTRGGVRLKQHGVVVCELRSSAGPTHSVFDVLAALMVALPVPGPAALLGFSAGGMVAPLAALGWDRPLAAVDLDTKAFAVFRRHCPEWRSRVKFHRAEAGAWLRRRRSRFGLLVEDLSVPVSGDVVKPRASWEELPELIRRRLHPEGVAVFNLLPDPEHPWNRAIPTIRGRFRAALVVRFRDYENRILVVGERLPSARALSGRLGRLLRELGSRQAGRIQVVAG